MYVTEVPYGPSVMEGDLQQQQAQMRQDNQVIEQKRRKAIHTFVDKMIDLMKEETSKASSRDLKITFIFER